MSGVQRLVYSPRAYVFVKDRNGDIHNLTDYVVAGNVTRKIDQVSTATVTLRNPQMLFTTHVGDDGQIVDALFRPMDPITIYLQRIDKRPVRVFTGFLDQTPYIQLFPGVIKLQASCTLKRLLNTFFDPSLPYTQQFLQSLGWFPSANGSMTSLNALGAISGTGLGSTSKQIYSVGDSLGVGAFGPLKKILTGYSVENDNLVGMTTATGISLLSARAMKGSLPTNVLVSLGTNDGPYTDVAGFKGHIADAIRIVGSGRHLIWVNLNGMINGQSTTAFNKALDDAASNHPNLTVVDYKSLVDNGSVKATPDGVHTDTSGYTARATAIASQIRKGANVSEPGSSIVAPQATDVDGSLGQLIYETLKQIGGWDADEVYIETIPESVFDRIVELASEFIQENQAAQLEFKDLLKKIAGAGAYGSSSPSSSDSSQPTANTPSGSSGKFTAGGKNSTGPVAEGAKSVVPILVAIANAYNLPPAFVVAVQIVENEYKNTDGGGTISGWFQQTVGTKCYAYGRFSTRACTYAETKDLGIACSAFCEAAVGWLKAKPSEKDNWEQWAIDVQGISSNLSGNSRYSNPSLWNGFVAQAKSDVSTYGNASTPLNSTTNPLTGLGATTSNVSNSTTSSDGANADSNTTTRSKSKGGSTKTSTGSDNIPAFTPHGGNTGFFPASGTNYTNGDEPQLAARLDYMGKALGLKLVGLSGYRTPAYSVSVGGFANDPHTKGAASDTPGTENIPESTLNKYGLTRPFDTITNGTHDTPAEADHMQLLSGSQINPGANKSQASNTVDTSGTGIVGGGTVSTKFAYPLAKKATSQGGGPGQGTHSFTDPPNNWESDNAVDLFQAAGTPWIAVEDGVISQTAGWGKSDSSIGTVFGYRLELDGDSGDKYFYQHGDSSLAAQGKKVKKGEVIGAIGPASMFKQAGVPTHLHFAAMNGNPENIIAGADVASGSTNTLADGGQGTTADSTSNSSTGAALWGSIELPTMMTSAEALLLGGDLSLLNDSPLFPFIQQLCNASLRHFQSLPDGRFYAFFPDYFGEIGTHPPYWEIDNIEILDGGVDLSDASLVTHMYVVGNITLPTTEIPLAYRAVASSGVVTIYNMFMANSVLNRTKARDADLKAAKSSAKNSDKGYLSEPPAGMNFLLDREEAANFLQRYGARPILEDTPWIASPYYEMFLAYQHFLLAWSKQFSTPFTFTFMPELFPGGKVGFPDHGLAMYIEEVSHDWDYTSGFTTMTTMSAPQQYGKDNPLLPPNMVRAIVDPILKAEKSHTPVHHPTVGHGAI